MKTVHIQNGKPKSNHWIIPVLAKQQNPFAHLSSNIQSELDAFMDVKKPIHKEEILLPLKNKTIAIVSLKKSEYKDIYKSLRKFAHQNPEFFQSEKASLLLGNKGKAMLMPSLNGLVVGAQNLGSIKTDDDHSHPLQDSHFELDICSELSEELANIHIERGSIVAQSQLNAMKLGNAPSNKKSPEYIATYTKVKGEKFGFEVEVLNEEEIEFEGLRALQAVNRGSEHPARLVLGHYNREREDLPYVGLVGKGVTFDTGGISIKPSDNLHLMKSDMCGAAAVLGAMEAVSRLKLPIRLSIAIPLTDNLVDAKSIKPGDVIGSYLGKTIEIIDTDAEGRLILADALTYLNKNYSPEYLIDMATLTGATVRAMGYHAATLFTENKKLEELLLQAGQECGEKLWPMPLWEEYEEDIQSDIADLRNFSGKPVAGAISAAKFLQVFTQKHPAWAHIDIAGVAFESNEFGSQKNASGYGVLLITNFILALLENK